MIRRYFEKTSPVKKIRTFTSVKSKEVFFCESALELHACLVMEFNDSVVYYKAQPDSFKYRKGYPYTPDLLVVLENGDSFFVEVKPYDVTIEAHFIAKLQLLTDYFSIAEKRLVVLTDRDLYIDGVKENCTHLYRYRTEPIDPNYLATFQAIGKGRATWKAFRERLKALGLPGYFAHQLLAYKLVSFDFKAPINDATQVVWS